MPNTNFQTFHQMGQAINAVVKQATGRDAVQNIDMDHVTVAQNHYYEEFTLSASKVSFNDRVGNTPLEKCVVQIEPVQDLHGYSKPWAGGAGVNKCPTFADGTHTLSNGITVTISNGEITINGTPTGPGLWEETIPETLLPENGYISINNPSITYAVALVYIMDNSQVYNTAPSAVYRTASIETASGRMVNKLRIYFNGDGSFDNFKMSPIIHVGSTPQTFVPYSNICPITGWTRANIHVSPTTNAQDGRTYSIAFPAEAGTVYGGTLTVNADGSGTLVVDKQILQMDSLNWLYESATSGFVYNNTNIKHSTSGKLISSIFGWSTESKANMPNNSIRINSASAGGLFVKSLNISSSSDFNTLINGQTVVFPLETPVTYTITTEQIKTIQGTNTIWADTGNIEVTIKVLKELY